MSTEEKGVAQKPEEGVNVQVLLRCRCVDMLLLPQNREWGREGVKLTLTWSTQTREREGGRGADAAGHHL